MTASKSTRTPQQALAALLELHKPAHLLLLGESDLPAISAYSANHPESLVFQATADSFQADLAAQRFDLAIIAGRPQKRQWRAAVSDRGDNPAVLGANRHFD